MLGWSVCDVTMKCVWCLREMCVLMSWNECDVAIKCVYCWGELCGKLGWSVCDVTVKCVWCWDEMCVMSQWSERDVVVNTARKACKLAAVFNRTTARISLQYDGNDYRVDSYVFACVFRKCTTFEGRLSYSLSSGTPQFSPHFERQSVFDLVLHAAVVARWRAAHAYLDLIVIIEILYIFSNWFQKFQRTLYISLF